LKNYFGGRGLAAARGIFAFAFATIAVTSAPAQVATANATIVQAVNASTAYLSNGQVVRTAISTPAATIARAPITMTNSIASTLPLSAMVAMYAAAAPLDEQTNCLAVAVYHEARGETLEGQLAVANVVINRARSGRYPPTWCEVVKQPWQFSFVRKGRFPPVDAGSRAWWNAQSIARIAASNAAAAVPSDCLWYHADYVAPSWGRRLTRVEKIGAHIFYRA
jgi:spore germination cell wall hydrolase CwlJ-like protein